MVVTDEGSGDALYQVCQFSIWINLDGVKDENWHSWQTTLTDRREVSDG